MQNLVSKSIAVLVVLAFCATLWGQPTDRNAAGRQARRAERLQGRKRIQPTKADIPYASYERNVIDFYQAQSDKPAPLAVFIHGGGFRGGSKRGLNRMALPWAGWRRPPHGA